MKKIIIENKLYILDCMLYRDFSPDLVHFTDQELEEHFIAYGHHENRIFNNETLTQKHPLLAYFVLDDYKKNNPDLSLVSDGAYILDYLQNRLNDNRVISEKLLEFKKKKYEKINNLLVHKIVDENYLSLQEKKDFCITGSHTISSNEWQLGSMIDSLIKKSPLVLNIGAGYRADTGMYFMYDNVINTEVFPYCTTDIVCNGDRLPFKDNSFDAILSLDVLEHVPNPFDHAKEMLRVLKPGGTLYVDVPFLQPYHGYPYHYYNMTTIGVRNLFGKQIEVIEHAINDWQKPICTLTWFLSNYCNGLDEKTKASFLQMTIKNILDKGNNLSLDYVKNLSKEAEEINACGSALVAKKL